MRAIQQIQFCNLLVSIVRTLRYVKAVIQRSTYIHAPAVAVTIATQRIVGLENKLKLTNIDAEVGLIQLSSKMSSASCDVTASSLPSLGTYIYCKTTVPLQRTLYPCTTKTGLSQ
jgi:hypothetical protein